MRQPSTAYGSSTEMHHNEGNAVCLTLQNAQPASSKEEAAQSAQAHHVCCMCNTAGRPGMQRTAHLCSNLLTCRQTIQHPGPCQQHANRRTSCGFTSNKHSASVHLLSEGVFHRSASALHDAQPCTPFSLCSLQNCPHALCDALLTNTFTFTTSADATVPRTAVHIAFV